MKDTNQQKEEPNFNFDEKETEMVRGLMKNDFVFMEELYKAKDR